MEEKIEKQLKSVFLHRSFHTILLITNNNIHFNNNKEIEKTFLHISIYWVYKDL